MAIPAQTPETPARSSLMMIPRPGDTVEAEDKAETEEKPPPRTAAEARELMVPSPQPSAAPLAPRGNACTRSEVTPTQATGTPVAFAAEQSAGISASPGNADTKPVMYLTTTADCSAGESVFPRNADTRPMRSLITPIAGPTAAATEQSVTKPR
ncbi:unnamed protein product [Phytophthora fragariaefolia]|uniref:Unnamed protein product n=1 Tax=Phytophthora fragariaefolia TaxID=1490495 RepID=A0A9W6XU67_9STRA|nr:unnamed protein product [Phytophthora fragariaefolia]